MALIVSTANETRAEAPAPVTFTEHVAPIVFQNCASCHRPGEGTPFSLLSYRDVKKRGELIRNVVDEGFMPPWPPAKGWGHFQDERRLSAEQISLLDRWVESGMAEGPAEKLPALPKFAEGGWSLGKPDMVVTLPEEFDVPADGPDIYRMFVLPLAL
ncbi:c-type cytochrome, partial [Singulisphaera rosea]